MYVLGGFGGDDSLMAQMFSIDLSKSWSTSSPAYKRMADGITDARFTSVLLPNNKDWFVISNSTVYLYNIPSGTWSTVGKYNTLSTSHGLSAAVDPENGKVYIPNGYVFSKGGGGPVELMVYSTSDKTVQHNIMTSNLVQVINFSVVWASTLKGLLLFGGSVINTPNTRSDLYFYSPESGWKLLTPRGDIPTARRLACFVPAYGGTKMVLFGGQGDPVPPAQNGNAQNDIYILDVATLTWTRGPDIGNNGGRAGHVCAISNEQLISWGGLGNDASSDNNTFVYNLKTSSWTTEYIGTSGSSSTNLVPIIAGSIGGVVLVALLVGGFIFYRRKKAKEQAVKSIRLSKPYISNPTPFEYNQYSPQSPPHSRPQSQEQQYQRQQQRQQQHNSYYNDLPSEEEYYLPQQHPSQSYNSHGQSYDQNDYSYDDYNNYTSPNESYYRQNNQTAHNPYRHR
ncbi:hypothetical protein BX616_003757 [Lobosporangium transversale]|nr:hypothetical protein BX616_003757 [Lobosporangium transversale]